MDTFEAIENIIHDLEIYHDSYTELHECRTGRLMSMLGKAFSLDEQFCKSLEMSGSMHDIGKLAIPAQILEKPGALSASEREVVKLHVEIGHKIMVKVKHPLAELTSTIILTHHEAYDGSGYPHGLKGEQIPLEGRICTICDVYDALISHRPYRNKQAHEKIIEMMLDTGSTGLAGKFDPVLLEAFVGIGNQISSFYAINATDNKPDLSSE